MHDDERAYYITDTSLAELADGLSRTAPPLLALTRPPVPQAERMQESVTATDLGRAVLSGQKDRIETCGIARWRWDAASHRITSRAGR